MCDIGYAFCRNQTRTEDTGRVDHIRSPETTNDRNINDAIVNNAEGHHYESLHHQQSSTHVYENQGVVPGRAGVAASMEDGEYMEIM